jgi:peroxiredoxin
VELSYNKTRFEALSVNLAVISYDSPDVNLAFSNKYNLSFPLLSDDKAILASAFGILNESYPKGHRAYGVPHPGVFMVDSKGVVYAKFSEKDYRKRPALELILEAAKGMSRQ